MRRAGRGGRGLKPPIVAERRPPTLGLSVRARRLQPGQLGRVARPFLARGRDLGRHRQVFARAGQVAQLRMGARQPVVQLGVVAGARELALEQFARQRGERGDRAAGRAALGLGDGEFLFGCISRIDAFH